MIVPASHLSHSAGIGIVLSQSFPVGEHVGVRKSSAPSLLPKATHDNQQEINRDYKKNIKTKKKEKQKELVETVSIEEDIFECQRDHCVYKTLMLLMVPEIIFLFVEMVEGEGQYLSQEQRNNLEQDLNSHMSEVHYSQTFIKMDKYFIHYLLDTQFLLYIDDYILIMVVFFFLDSFTLSITLHALLTCLG